MVAPASSCPACGSATVTDVTAQRETAVIFTGGHKHPLRGQGLRHELRPCPVTACVRCEWLEVAR